MAAKWEDSSIDQQTASGLNKIKNKEAMRSYFEIVFQLKNYILFQIYFLELELLHFRS